MSEVKEVEVSKLRKVLQKYSEHQEEYMYDRDKHRLGKVLTIVDGAISDEVQRKAIKDLINDAWYQYSPIDQSPRLRQVTEALGFDLWEAPVIPKGVTANEPYNHYKDLVK